MTKLIVAFRNFTNWPKPSQDEARPALPQIVVLFYVLFVLCRSVCVNVYCTVLLPPGDNPIAVNKYIYRVSQEEWTKLRESVPYVKIYRYNPKHLYPKLNGHGDNGQRSLKV